MTSDDSTLWLMLLIGGLAGWWWRGRCERQRHRDDLPQWLAKLGHGLAAQFRRLDQGHLFAGDDVEVINEQTYEGGGKAFVVSVRRKQHVTIDQ